MRNVEYIRWEMPNDFSTEGCSLHRDAYDRNAYLRAHASEQPDVDCFFVPQPRDIGIAHVADELYARIQGNGLRLPYAEQLELEAKGLLRRGTPEKPIWSVNQWLR